MSPSHRLPLLCLCLAILMGSWGRLAHLGEREMWTDELNHHFAARSIAAGNGPTLPSGETYVRGLSISRAVAFTQRHVGDPELAVRLPSAIFGVVNLALMAVVAWMLAGPWAAVWATILLAIYPEAVDQSRTGRFYTYQLNFGLIVLAGGWFATRARIASDADIARHLTTRWAWMVLAIVALIVAYRIQPTTLPVAIALLAWVALVGAGDLLRDGTHAFRRSVPVQASALLLLVLMGSLVTGHLQPLLAQWWSRAGSAATWVDPGSTSRRFYLGKLTERIPWVMSLLPFFTLIALRRAPRLTFYLLTWFLIPLVIHSLLLTWKGERYFLLPLPALFILAGIGASAALGFFGRVVRDFLAERHVAFVRPVSHGIITAASLWAIITLPGFAKTRHFRSDSPNSTPWRVSGEILRQTPGIADIPWGSMDPLVSLHFWGRVDFGIQPGLFDYAIAPAPRHPPLRFPPAVEPVPRDYYAGVPIAVTPASIRKAYEGYGAVIIGLYPDWRTFVDPDLSSTLAREGRDLCQLRCPDGFRLYLWRLKETSTAGGT